MSKKERVNPIFEILESQIGWNQHLMVSRSNGWIYCVMIQNKKKLHILHFQFGGYPRSNIL